jgi:hypothetical protein
VSINSSSSFLFRFFFQKMKCKEIMTHILFDTMPSWMKYQNEKDFRVVRKVIIISFGVSFSID